MKILPEHVAIMKAAIDSFIDKNGGLAKIVNVYETGNFPRSERCKDLNARFVWDMFYYAKLTPFACDTLYKYVNDSHIETALKSVLPRITKNY